LSVSIMAILAGSVMSALVLAGRAMPTNTVAESCDRLTARVMEQIIADLTFAESFTVISAHAIEFKVADRGHGASGPETIRYEWPGVAGGALRKRYNNGAYSTIPTADDFTFSPALAAGDALAVPNVLMVVGDTGLLDSFDAQRQRLLTAWGFNVTLIADEAA